jgi:Uma2 family endonuclease
MPIVSTARMTASQFMALGDDPPGIRLELVNGEVAVAPSATPEHSNSDNEFRFLLKNHVDEHDLGMILSDLDTPLDMFNVRRPDILYFSKPRLHLVTRKVLKGPPDLCIEIVSPSSATIDRVDKFNQYREARVAYYWILDPIARSLEGFRLQRGKYVLVGEGRNDNVISLPPFPKLQIPLSKLWWPDRASVPAPPRRRRARNGEHGNGH